MIKRLIDFLYCAALVIYVLAGVPLTPFHGDEATQIYMSRDYAYQFILNNWALVRFSNPPISAQEQELRLLNGTLNKYLIGLAWHSTGCTLDDLNQQWDWGADYAYNIANGHAPTAGLLHTARIPSALLTAAGVVIIFVVGYLTGGRTAAFVASALFALNPAVLVNGRRAMMEGGLLAFTLLSVLAGVWFARSGASWRAALALGIAAGLALAAKHTAAFALIGVFAGCALMPAWKRAIPRLFAAGVIALAVFYALNPAWWGDPLARVGDVLRLRQNLLDIQVAVFGAYPDAGAALIGFIRQAGMPVPQHFEAAAWASYIADEIATYDASFWRGVALGDLSSAAILLLGSVGVYALLRRGNATERLIVVCGAFALFSTLLLTPLNWQRYYLPIYPALALWSACGIVYLLRLTGWRRHWQAGAALFSN